MGENSWASFLVGIFGFCTDGLYTPGVRYNLTLWSTLFLVFIRETAVDDRWCPFEPTLLRKLRNASGWSEKKAKLTMPFLVLLGAKLKQGKFKKKNWTDEAEIRF